MATAAIQEELRRRLAQLAHTQQELRDVKGTLHKLTEGTRAPVMVPLSGAGFMRGFVEHTNEVLVPLGCDLFVWRSERQAAAIIDRRLAALEADMKELRSQLQDVEKAASVRAGLVKLAQAMEARDRAARGGNRDQGGLPFEEIREPYTEEDAKRDEARRTGAVTTAPPSRAHAPATDGANSDDDDSLFANLEALEAAEAAAVAAGEDVFVDAGVLGGTGEDGTGTPPGRAGQEESKDAPPASAGQEESKGTPHTDRGQEESAGVATPTSAVQQGSKTVVSAAVSAPAPSLTAARRTKAKSRAAKAASAVSIRSPLASAASAAPVPMPTPSPAAPLPAAAAAAASRVRAPAVPIRSPLATAAAGPATAALPTASTAGAKPRKKKMSRFKAEMMRRRGQL